MKKSILISILTGISSLILFTAYTKAPLPGDYWLDYIVTNFQRFIKVYHQNKVYIQTDKNVYESGETIFFKAYVFDDAQKGPENLVKNLYVDLIAPDKKVFMQRLLKIESGFAYGDFPVLDTIYTGLFLLRAYTQNMKNAGNDYLFTKEIRINHPEKLFYDKIFHKKAKKIHRQSEEIDLQFFPEGGELAADIKSTVAFKAINQSGKGVHVEGKIFSGKEVYICDFASSHLGMGKFEFTPVPHEKYYARLTTKEGKKLKVELPEVQMNNYQLSVEDNDQGFKVSIATNKQFAADPVARTVYLIVQAGGNIYSSGKHLFETNQINLNIGKKNFPSGVIHFTLFDAQGMPRCERLAFVNHHDSLVVNTNLSKNSFNKRETIEFDLSSLDESGNPVASDLAISVAEKSDFGKDNPSIRSYLLLQADLRGKIENPDYYFSKHQDAAKHLDLLLLTQGWRKFLWKDILADSIPKPKFPYETDLRITGRITKYLFDIPVKNASLTLTLLNQFNDVFKTKSGKKGYFEFTGLDYPDTLDVLIEVRTQYNRKNVLIVLDENIDIDNEFFPVKGFYLDSLKKRHKPEYKKIPEEPDDPNVPKDFKLHSQADQVIKFTDQMRSSSQSVLDALRGRVPGLSIGNGGSSIRGGSSIFGSNEPLYLIDGMPTNYQGIQSVNIYDVEYVEILKGPSSAIYGLRGANGVIAVYTKKGHFYKRGEIRFKMLGYHTPKKFYTPKYESNNEEEDPQNTFDSRKTILWLPKVKTDEQGQAKIKFKHSDIPGEFVISIEGVDQRGRLGKYQYFYKVK